MLADVRMRALKDDVDVDDNTDWTEMLMEG
jgi:hypothetical protein